MSLSQSTSAWAEAVLSAKSRKSAIERVDALAAVAHSPFNIEIGAKKLAEVYESQASN
jgi:hypothetical protein